MTDDQSREILLRHYRTLWYGLEWAAIAAPWQTEYVAVSAGAFSPLLVTQTGFEGGTVTGQKQLEQMLRVEVLQTFRASRDADYSAAIFIAVTLESARPTIMYPIFSGCYAH